MRAVRLVLTRDAEQFAARADRFLAERVERNVLATVLLLARGREPEEAEEPLFAYAEREDGEVHGAALRTPPWPPLASELHGELAVELIERWLPQDPSVRGVSGQPASARAIADAWAARSGGRTVCRMREAIHVLSEVTDPPRPSPGRLRQAAGEERDLLIGWERAFASEAGLAVSSEAEHVVSGRLGRGAQFVWDDEGPVATLAMSPPIAGTVRIGPVYTPPERRRHGYATNLVAAASRRALAAGARQCMLFTDLANPTSNRIYAAVGYRRCGDWEEYGFVAP